MEFTYSYEKSLKRELRAPGEVIHRYPMPAQTSTRRSPIWYCCKQESTNEAISLGRNIWTAAPIFLPEYCQSEVKFGLVKPNASCETAVVSLFSSSVDVEIGKVLLITRTRFGRSWGIQRGVHYQYTIIIERGLFRFTELSISHIFKKQAGDD